MQILIYKTELSVERAPGWLAPNVPVRLMPEPDGLAGAYADRPPRLFRLIPGRPVRIGTMNEAASDLLAPAIEGGMPLRVRIVELGQAHLASDGRARISVSVWGEPSWVSPSSPHPLKGSS